MLNTVTLLGSSSGRNTGDAALIAAIMNDVDRAVGRPLLYEIPTIRPGYLRAEYPNRTRPVGMMPWQGALRMLGVPTARSLWRTDAVVIFDAVLFDRSLFNPLFNFLSSIWLLLPLAHRRGIPVIGYNVGIGPVDTRAGRRMLRDVAGRMQFLTVRDGDSLDLLRACGVRNPNVRLTADAALNAPSWDDARVDPILEKAGLRPGEPALGINVNRYLDSWASAGRQPMSRERFLSVFAEGLREAAGDIGVPVVFVTTQHHDADLTLDLMRRMPAGIRTAFIDNRTLGHEAVKGVLRRLSLLFGMRLHSVILASAEGTPVIGLRYQPKVAFYFKELGLSEYVMTFDEFSPERLCDHIRRGWADRDRLRDALARRIPELQRRAGRSAEWIASIDRGEWSGLPEADPPGAEETP